MRTLIKRMNDWADRDKVEGLLTSPRWRLTRTPDGAYVRERTR